MNSVVHVAPWTRIVVVLSMLVVIVAVDAAFFRGHFWPRLAVNVGLVLVMGAFWWRFAPRR